VIAIILCIEVAKADNQIPIKKETEDKTTFEKLKEGAREAFDFTAEKLKEGVKTVKETIAGKVEEEKKKKSHQTFSRNKA